MNMTQMFPNTKDGYASADAMNDTTALSVVKSETFDGVLCDLYQDNADSEKVYLTREQIGTALGYSDPQKAIDNLHTRHKDRLDKFSATVKLRAADGKLYDTTVYTYKGACEICRFSRQPKADAFMDFVWEIVEAIRTGKVSLYSAKTPRFDASDVATIAAQAATKAVVDALPNIIKAVQDSVPHASVPPLQQISKNDPRFAGYPDPLNVKQVQAILGTNPMKTYDIFNSDNFPSQKIGYKWYVSLDGLVSWLNTLALHGIFM